MVMYYMPSFYYLVIDQQNLDQGLISIVTFALYREIEHEISEAVSTCSSHKHASIWTISL
jgi:hypothetical protein